jgi:protease-4
MIRHEQGASIRVCAAALTVPTGCCYTQIPMSDEQIPPPPPPAPDFRTAPPPPGYQQPGYTPYAAPAYGAPYAAPYGAAAPRRSGWFWAAITVGILALLVIAVVAMMNRMMKSAFDDSSSTSTAFSSDSIAVIDISGVITDADKIDKQIDKFGDDSSVKAIILHIDSPGGGAAASQEIYHDVLRVRQEKHKKIIASVESMGASGAYYIASACDRIYANPASVVGSIGVIMEWTNYGDLMRWAKLKNIVIHAGELKDAGDPTRDLTPKEEAYFQSLVDNMYGQFVHDVAVGRQSTDDAIKPLATGQVWTGEQALGLHLIDQEGGFHTALLDTAKSVGISGEPHIVRPTKEKKGLYAFLNGEGDDLFPDPSKLLDRAPGFYFLWK